MHRRDFFRLLLGVPFALAAPTSMATTQGKTLILIELSGGNDGLNTLVPYRDPLYAKLRPKLALKPEQLLPISENLALNPALSALYPWWKKGNLAWVQGLGYPHRIAHTLAHWIFGKRDRAVNKASVKAG